MPVFDFDEARAAVEQASETQEKLEEDVRRAYREAAEADELYRVRLSQEIMVAYDAGVKSWSAATEVARGKADVAALRKDREYKEGVKEAVSQAAFRVGADRRDLSKLLDWSARVSAATGDAW